MLKRLFFFLLFILIASTLIISCSTSPQESDGTEENNISTEDQKNQLTTDALDVFIEESSDAGQKYIDSFIFLGESTTYHLKSRGVLSGGTETTQVWAPKSGTLMLDHTISECRIVYPQSKAEMELGEALRHNKPKYILLTFGLNGAVASVSRGENYFKGCYGKLYTEGGYVLLMGVGHDKNTYIHAVEEMLSVPDRMTEEKVERTIIKENGEEEKRYVKWFYSTAAEDVSEYFWKFEPAFRYHGCIVDGFLGNAKTQLCDARKMKEVYELIFKNSGGKEFAGDDTPIDERFYK
jgi:aminoglycoside 3-N-acetyltransferase